MHHFFWFLISSSSFDALADRFYLHGQEHRTSGYQSLCNCGDYREDIQDVSLTISISLKAFLKSFGFGSWCPFSFSCSKAISLRPLTHHTFKRGPYAKPCWDGDPQSRAA
jgi:hypothetical protein